ncbi:MAG TPA: HDOD domain-containing protein, partial [Polyangiaceae bacterium]|nr:HDOD domain-containing protein [Polyangiaceae bacterium]
NNLAAAMALFATFRSKAELTLQLHELCVASASIAHGIAKKTQHAPPSTAFVCGLLCEIGAMACLVFDGKEYVKLWQHASGDPQNRGELERERYGVSSYEIGRRFLERNSLPPNVSAAVGADLIKDPEQADPLGKITVVARHAPTAIARGVGQPDQLRAGLAELADRVKLPKLDGELLFDICAKVGAFLAPT